MPRECICKICKSKLTTDKAYKVRSGKTNNYYCSKDEFDKYVEDLEKKEKCFNTIAIILNEPIITPMMKKELKQINNFYDYIVIERTFKECSSNIRWFLENKEIPSEYAKTRYIITIIKNNINAVQKKYIEEQKEIERLFNNQGKQSTDVDIINIDIEQSNTVSRVPDISSFLD